MGSINVTTGGPRAEVRPEFVQEVSTVLFTLQAVSVADVEAQMPLWAGRDIESILKDLVAQGVAKTASSLGTGTIYTLTTRTIADEATKVGPIQL